MITSVIKCFYGSTPDDFDSDRDDHPFKPCPDSPNCAVHSVEYPESDRVLFETVKSAIDSFSPFKSDSDSQSLQINVVFRIPLFGFMDDVSIIIQPKSPHKSLLHIKSASRVGRSDLGVNRRRIERIISAINQQLEL